MTQSRFPRAPSSGLSATFSPEAGEKGHWQAGLVSHESRSSYIRMKHACHESPLQR